MDIQELVCMNSCYRSYL